jgi:hypothetical protein
LPARLSQRVQRSQAWRPGWGGVIRIDSVTPPIQRGPTESVTSVNARTAHVSHPQRTISTWTLDPVYRVNRRSRIGRRIRTEIDCRRAV